MLIFKSQHFSGLGDTCYSLHCTAAPTIYYSANYTHVHTTLRLCFLNTFFMDHRFMNDLKKFCRKTTSKSTHQSYWQSTKELALMLIKFASQRTRHRNSKSWIFGRREEVWDHTQTPIGTKRIREETQNRDKRVMYPVELGTTGTTYTEGMAKIPTWACQAPERMSYIVRVLATELALMLVSIECTKLILSPELYNTK